MLADSVVVSGLAVVLEESLLEDLRSRFGGVAQDSGDAGGSLDWICYDLVGDSTQFEVGSGPLGGDVVITQFKLSGLGDLEGCMSSGLSLSEIQVQNGLPLGMSMAELQAKLGEGEQIGDTIRYTSLTSGRAVRPSGIEEKYGSVRALNVIVQDGRVASIESYKATTF